jgi:hypothetical protein
LKILCVVNVPESTKKLDARLSEGEITLSILAEARIHFLILSSQLRLGSGTRWYGRMARSSFKLDPMLATFWRRLVDTLRNKCPESRNEMGSFSRRMDSGKYIFLSLLKCANIYT